MKHLTKLLMAGAAFSALLSPAFAGTVDESLDPQIFVQDSGTSPAGGDPNLLNNNGPGVNNEFVVGVAGSATVQAPMLIIVGVRNGLGTPTITFPAGTVSTPVLGTYGLTGVTATFNAASSGSAYDQFGLTSGGSESFGNWKDADIAAGFGTPTSFTLDVFALSAQVAAGSPITVGESGAADGSFILAYSCELGASNTPDCNPNGKIGETPFTNSGLVDFDCPDCSPGTQSAPVPEPGSLAIFGSAILGLGVVGWFRRRKDGATDIAAA